MGATSALREEEGKGEPRIVGVCGGGATPDHQPAAAYPSAKRRVAGRRAHEPAVLPNGAWGIARGGGAASWGLLVDVRFCGLLGVICASAPHLHVRTRACTRVQFYVFCRRGERFAICG